MPRGRPKTKNLGKGRFGPNIERKPIRPLERQRMRPWLINLLDQNSCDQLVWLNRQDGTFKISWKHAAGQTFDPKADATLFQRWAQHTGKYYTGDRPDPKKWKANFRCAMHSLPDVEEDKSLGVRRGNNAYRVYRFLDEKKTRKTVGVKREREDRDTDDDEEEADYEDECNVLRNLGTKSRPRKIEYDELDSEGSETGYSPSHSDHSDWSLTSADLRRQDHETESKSPLPNFEELCQSAPALFPKASKKQKRVPDIPAMKFPVMKSEPVDTFSELQYTIIVENQPINDDLQNSDTDIDLCVSFDDPEVAEATQMIDQEFWNTIPDCGVDLQEEVVISGNEGPSVIVVEEKMDSYDYTYTSIADL